MFKDKLEKKITNWTDEECLEHFSQFFERVGVTVQFIESEEGMFTHQLLTIRCGDKVIVSEPQQLEWPLQLMDLPEAFEGRIN